MEQEREIQFGELLRRIGITLKKNWLILALIIAIFSVAGIGYAFYRKPIYTSTQEAVYSAKIDPENKSLNDYTITLSYLDTFVDFCSQDVVLQRANFYYNEYVKSNVGIDGLQGFVDGVKKTEIYTGSYDGEEYISAKDVTVSASSATDNSVSFYILVQCSDLVPEVSMAKAKILTLAIDREAKEPADSTEFGEYKYFGAYVSLEDYGYKGYQKDLSKTKIIAIAFILGVVVALVTVYLMYLLNRTVREKEELETLTGTSVLAFISNTEGGKKNGRNKK
jgi:hypothetical protein